MNGRCIVDDSGPPAGKDSDCGGNKAPSAALTMPEARAAVQKDALAELGFIFGVHL